MILACGAAAAVLILWNLDQTIKRKKEEKPYILLSSFLSLAVFPSYNLPSGHISGAPLGNYT